MGYQRERKIYRLVFADPEYEGLEVRVTAPPMGMILDTADLADVDLTNPKAADIRRTTTLFGAFADCLVDWNLEADGIPVSPTREGVLSQDADFVMFLLTEWIKATMGVSAPLGTRSANGGLSGVVSIPTETLSPNLPS